MKEYTIKINGNDYVVSIDNLSGASAEVAVNGAIYTVELAGETVRPAKAGRPQVVATPSTHPIQPAKVVVGQPASKPAAASEAPVKSPLPGVILDVKVKEGDTVAAGQLLVVLEAMKMENNIESDRAGVIRSIKVNRGDSVLEGDVLVTIG